MMSRMPQPRRRDRRSQSLVTREQEPPYRPPVVVREREFLEFGEGVAAHVVEDAGRDLAAEGDEEARAGGDDHRQDEICDGIWPYDSLQALADSLVDDVHRQEGQEADLAGAVDHAARRAWAPGTACRAGCTGRSSATSGRFRLPWNSSSWGPNWLMRGPPRGRRPALLSAGRSRRGPDFPGPACRGPRSGSPTAAGTGRPGGRVARAGRPGRCGRRPAR